MGPQFYHPHFTGRFSRYLNQAFWISPYIYIYTYIYISPYIYIYTHIYIYFNHLGGSPHFHQPRVQPHLCSTWFTNSLGGGPSEKSWLCGSANKRRALIWRWRVLNRKGGDPRTFCKYMYIYIYVDTYVYIYIHIVLYVILYCIWHIIHSICLFFDHVYNISILYAFEFVWSKSFDPNTCHDIRILINLWFDTVG